MQDKLQESLKFLELAKENSDLRSAAEELRKEKKKIEDRLMAVYFILFFVAIFLGVGCYLANDGYKDSQEIISSLESDIEEVTAERNEFEDACYYFDDYVEFLQGELDEYDYWEKLADVEATVSSDGERSFIVYITEADDMFHKEGCQSLSESKYPMDIKDASYYGCFPCPQCY